LLSSWKFWSRSFQIYQKKLMNFWNQCSRTA
jgi:hypothetical protein